MLFLHTKKKIKDLPIYYDLCKKKMIQSSPICLHNEELLSENYNRTLR